jgi:hypothetical protein
VLARSFLKLTASKPEAWRTSSKHHLDTAGKTIREGKVASGSYGHAYPFLVEP